MFVKSVIEIGTDDKLDDLFFSMVSRNIETKERTLILNPEYYSLSRNIRNLVLGSEGYLNVISKPNSYSISFYAGEPASKPLVHVIIPDAHLYSTRRYNQFVRVLKPQKSWTESRLNANRTNTIAA